MKYYTSVDQIIGRTPLLKVNNFIDGLKANLFVKLESLNPAGSIKDRASLYMINEAERLGLIKKGATIIEPTSGNTGIGIAMICASRGYKAMFTMPDTMSKERIKMLTAYGGKVVLTDGKLGMKGAIEKAEQLNGQIQNSCILDQFSNQANANAHYKETAKEIDEDLDGIVDAVIAGIGTGGTISGIGRYFKQKDASINIIGVEPKDSPLLNGGKAGAHKLQGIGANFIPKLYDKSVVDWIVDVDYSDAKTSANIMAKKVGILLGISSGACLYAGTIEARKEENKGKNIVAIMPDNGDRYFSSDLFE